MDRTFIVLAAALALSLSALAQESGSQPMHGATTNNVGVSTQHLGLETIVGCLSKYDDDSFAVLGGNPGAKQFRIISGDVGALGHADGQDVKVLGIVGKNDPAANQNGIYNEGSTTGAGYLTLQLQEVKVIGAHCGSSGKEWEGDHMNDRKSH